MCKITIVTAYWKLHNKIAYILRYYDFINLFKLNTKIYLKKVKLLNI